MNKYCHVLTKIIRKSTLKIEIKIENDNVNDNIYIYKLQTNNALIQ